MLKKEMKDLFRTLSVNILFTAMTILGLDSFASNEIIKYQNGEFLPQFLVNTEDLPRPVLEASRSVVLFCKSSLEKDRCLTMFAIGENGLFVTNLHALRSLFLMTEYVCFTEGEMCGAHPLTYFTYDQNKKQPLVINPKVVKVGIEPENYKLQMSNDWDPKTDLSVIRNWDLAYVRVPELKAVPAIKIAANTRVGNKAYSVGYPLEFSDSFPLPSFGSGRVNFIHRNHIEGDFLFLSGMSGGPILNQNGELIGIGWGKYETLREILTSDEDRVKELVQYYEAWRKGQLRVPQERTYVLPASYLQPN